MQRLNRLVCSKLFLLANHPLNRLQSSPMATLSAESKKHYQKIIVMRHGDRMDNADPLWLPNATRKWDPPLHDEGHDRAISSGQNLLKSDYPIHRIFVSPFLRCLQTAFQVAQALSTTPSSNIKVSQSC